MLERKSSRAILVKDKKIFLFKFKFGMLQNGKTLWVTPGGGVENNETYEKCLKREVYEELGIRIICPEKYSYKREMEFTKSNGEKMISVERYYLS
jgi:8-oxo-dGTP pyrophosphatase MutT (NUDIX family)